MEECTAYLFYNIIVVVADQILLYTFLKLYMHGIKIIYAWSHGIIRI
jgi:hypothetical protein